MNKSAIKKFATEARTKLLEQVKQKAFELGITEEGIEEYPDSGDVINIRGELIDKKKREQLVKRVEAKGFEFVIEEMAYTWFNRFIALRFMEVNGYLPTGIRVLSSEDPKRVEPEIFRNVTLVKDSLNIDLDHVFDLQDEGDSEGLFKYLVIAQCNALHDVLPFMFEPLEDYSELLFPDNLLVEDSVIRQMITSIDEEDWKEVEIIGWLYQFYIAEKKELVDKLDTVGKEDIPAATQLFTPKWIVQYMVENSVGRLWQESHPDSMLQNKWEYYLEPVEQEPEVQAKLDELRNPDLKPEEITVMDPACGSGHILVYAFDILYQIYSEQGYLGTDIPELIFKHNLFGLEIDDRAAQLASFALVMQARSKDPNFLQKAVLPNIVSIQEPNDVKASFAYAKLSKEAKDVANELIETYKDAKNLGSIINPKIDNLEILKKELTAIQENNQSFTGYGDSGASRLNILIRQTKLLSNKYGVVITNPPYMGNRRMNNQLRNFLKVYYPDSRLDLFAVFLERTIQMTKDNGAIGTINQHSWMFLSSFEKLRKYILDTQAIQSLLHLGPRAFDEIGGEVVQSVAFVLRKYHELNFTGEFYRLVDGHNSEEKRKQYLESSNSYIQKTKAFDVIPGSPVSYWMTDKIDRVFGESTSLSSMLDIKAGLATGDNTRFQREWFEVNNKSISFSTNSIEETFSEEVKWYPCESGGFFRKWYGNRERIVNWQNDGYEIRNFRRKDGRLRSRPQNTTFYFKEGLTWTKLSSSRFGVRYKCGNSIFDDTGRSAFPKNKNVSILSTLGVLCSKLAFHFLELLNPTLSFTNNDIARIPVLEEELVNKEGLIEPLVKYAIDISKAEWDSYETSWDFKRHPLLLHNSSPSVEEAFDSWEDFADGQFRQLKANEEELNRIFIEIYGLEDELTPEVEDEYVTIRRADRERDVKSFVSYAVGCMFGRYSLDEEGLAFAGGDFDPDKYKSFTVSESNVLPILDDRYFEDDIVTCFVKFVKVTFGEEKLEENLEFIADSIINRRASESARDAIRRYFIRDFYKDHVRIYKRRPIYWLFKSPSGSFNALVYLHRYDQDTVSRLRTDYLLEFQDKLAAEDGSLKQLLTTDLTQREKNQINKRLKEIDKQMAELRKYDEVIHQLADKRIDLDLDDGVAVNHAKFGQALAKI